MQTMSQEIWDVSFMACQPSEHYTCQVCQWPEIAEVEQWHRIWRLLRAHWNTGWLRPVGPLTLMAARSFYIFFPTSFCGPFVFGSVPPASSSCRLLLLCLRFVFDTPSLSHHLSHTSLSHTILNTPSFTHHLSHTRTHLCRTPSFTHTHLFVTHHLSHTSFSHTFVTHHLLHTLDKK